MQHLTAKLKTWLKQYEHLPAQGSQKWKDDRVTSVGGSELFEMLRDEARVIASKLGLIPHPNLLPMVWGNVFETVIRNFMMCLLKMHIYECGSIPSAEVKGKKYSADGLGVVRWLCDMWDNIQRVFFVYLITLFEFKCPFTRPLIQGVIPGMYVPQVKSGMSDLAIPDIGLYTEAVFRICPISEMRNTPVVNEKIHFKNHMNPLAYGFMGLYMTELVEPGEEFKWTFRNMCHRMPYDYGSIDDKSSFHDLLKMIKAGIIKVYHSPIRTTDEQKRVLFLRQQKIPPLKSDVDLVAAYKAFQKFVDTKKYVQIGVLPWKMVDLNIVSIGKEPGYTKKYETEIKHCVDTLESLNAIPDFSDRVVRFSEMYGLNYAPPDNGISAKLAAMDGL